jgi:hypothetical protein
MAASGCVRLKVRRAAQEFSETPGAVHLIAVSQSKQWRRTAGCDRQTMPSLFVGLNPTLRVSRREIPIGPRSPPLGMRTFGARRRLSRANRHWPYRDLAMGVVRFLTDMGLFIGQIASVLFALWTFARVSLLETPRFRRDFIDVARCPLLCPSTIFFELIENT